MLDSINGLVADRLHRERDKRGWSLADLALQSGVSRAMISKIERAEASPTAELLNRLCAGLGITLSALFEAPAIPGGDGDLARRADQPEWRDPASGYVRRNLSPPASHAPFEIVEVIFPPGQRVVLESLRNSRIVQQIWLIEGEMSLGQGTRTWHLAPGDCLAMGLDQPIVFHNPGGRPARYAVVLTKPERT